MSAKLKLKESEYSGNARFLSVDREQALIKNFDLIRKMTRPATQTTAANIQVKPRDPKIKK